MRAAKPFACPNCGDPNRIYARLDVRWNDATQKWEPLSGCQTECTDCDYQFGSGDEPEASAPIACDALHMAGPALLKALAWAARMAEEAISVREAGDDPEDTPEMIALHRESLEEARAAIAAAEGKA